MLTMVINGATLIMNKNGEILYILVDGERIEYPWAV